MGLPLTLPIEILHPISSLVLLVQGNKNRKQAGAELGQAQVKDEAVVLVEVVDEVGVQLPVRLGGGWWVGGRIKLK